MLKTKLKGNDVSLSGDIKVGDKASEVEVVLTDLSTKKVGGAKDKLQLLIAVPSLDTPVCATETRKFNEIVGNMKDIDVTVISMDLPFASKRFCSTEGVENIAVASDFRNKDFGKAYGILITDGVLQGLLARAIFIVGKDGTIKYFQLVPEITSEPNYNEVLNTLETLK